MISNKRRAGFVAALAVPALLLGACGKKEDGGGDATNDAKVDTTVSGSVKISGSSTVEPISALVAEDFMGQNKNVKISVDGPGTGDGFELFCAGETDISDASRPIKDEEAEACKAKGIEFIELEVGIDGISVITSPDNKLECLNFADLYALAGPEAEGYKKWTDAQAVATELGSKTEFPDNNLVVTAPGAESGTYDSFIEIALAMVGEARAEEGKIDEKKAETTRADYSASPDDNAIIEGVSGDPGGFGWVGFAFADQADGVKMMPIAKEEGGDCVAPSAESIQDGSYPISRKLYIYVNKAKAESNKAVAAYVDFYLEGLDSFVEASDYVPLDDNSASTKAWADRTPGTRVK